MTPDEMRVYLESDVDAPVRAARQILDWLQLHPEDESLDASEMFDWLQLHPEDESLDASEMFDKVFPPGTCAFDTHHPTKNPEMLMISFPSEDA